MKLVTLIEDFVQKSHSNVEFVFNRPFPVSIYQSETIF